MKTGCRQRRGTGARGLALVGIEGGGSWGGRVGVEKHRFCYDGHMLRAARIEVRKKILSLIGNSK